jgi:NitT/TauT family transport system permease protein
VIRRALCAQLLFAFGKPRVWSLLGSKQGIGLLISIVQGAFNANAVFAAMIILVVTAWVPDFGMTWTEHRLVRWKPAQLNEPGA